MKISKVRASFLIFFLCLSTFSWLIPLIPIVNAELEEGDFSSWSIYHSFDDGDMGSLVGYDAYAIFNTEEDMAIFVESGSFVKTYNVSDESLTATILDPLLFGEAEYGGAYTTSVTGQYRVFFDSAQNNLTIWKDGVIAQSLNRTDLNFTDTQEICGASVSPSGKYVVAVGNGAAPDTGKWTVLVASGSVPADDDSEGDFSTWTVYDNNHDSDLNGVGDWGSFALFNATEEVAVFAWAGVYAKRYTVATKNLGSSLFTPFYFGEAEYGGGQYTTSVRGRYSVFVNNTQTEVYIFKDAEVNQTFSKAQLNLDASQDIVSASISHSGKYVVVCADNAGAYDAEWIVLYDSGALPSSDTSEGDYDTWDLEDSEADTIAGSGMDLYAIFNKNETEALFVWNGVFIKRYNVSTGILSADLGYTPFLQGEADFGTPYTSSAKGTYRVYINSAQNLLYVLKGGAVVDSFNPLNLGFDVADDILSASISPSGEYIVAACEDEWAILTYYDSTLYAVGVQIRVDLVVDSSGLEILLNGSSYINGEWSNFLADTYELNATCWFDDPVTYHFVEWTTTTPGNVVFENSTDADTNVTISGSGNIILDLETDGWLIYTYIRINGYEPYTNFIYTLDGMNYSDGDSVRLFTGAYQLNATPSIVTHITFLNWTCAGSVSVNDTADPTALLTVTANPSSVTLHLNATVDITHNRTGITNMDCKNWTIAEYRYYAFESEYIMTNSYLDTAQWSFIDFATHNVSAYFTNSSTEGVASYTEEYASTGLNGTYSYSWLNLTDQTLNVTIYLWLKYPLLDTMYIDLSINANCSGYGMTNSTDGWEIAQSDYFNVYSKGGAEQLYTGFSDSGEPLGGVAGRINGGDFFNLYAYNNSYAESYQYWRGLVHYKALFELQWDHGSYSGFPWEPPSQDFPDDSNIEIGWAYYARGAWCENKDAFVRLKLLSFGWQNNHQFCKFQMSFVVSGSTIYTDDVFGWFDDGSDSYKVWIDFWFNEANASSLMGERVSSYWFAMQDNSAWPWNAFTGSNWGVHRENQSTYLAFEVLEAEGSEDALSSTEIEMVRLRCRMEQFVSGYNYSFRIWKISEQDMTFDSTMRGIPTPSYQPPQIPSMPMGGFIGVIYSAIMWLAEMSGPGLMQFWYALVATLDTVFAWLGLPRGFSNIVDMLLDFWGWMISSFGYLGPVAGAIFDFLTGTFSKISSVFVQTVGQWVAMFQVFTQFLGGGFTAGIHVWNDLGLTTWLILAIILYPMYLVIVWDEEGIDAAINQISFLLNIVYMGAHFFIIIIQSALGVVSTIIESVPVVE